MSNFDEAHKDLEDGDYNTSLAKPGDSMNDGEIKHETSIRTLMKSKKEEDTYDLGEDVYAFIFFAPIFSFSFWFSIYVIGTKYIVYIILMFGIDREYNPDQYAESWIAKFFLIPVALSMKTDLMHSYFCFANVMYCDSLLEQSRHATKYKLWLSYFLRTVDGLLSLTVNVWLMLTTNETLSVFTNFAALYFLQDIDDVFYGLVQLGFFGDKLEYMAQQCAEIDLRRRSGDSNKKFFFLRISHMDTILFFVTAAPLYGLFFYGIYVILTHHGFQWDTVL